MQQTRTDSIQVNDNSKKIRHWGDGLRVCPGSPIARLSNLRSLCQGAVLILVQNFFSIIGMRGPLLEETRPLLHSRCALRTTKRKETLHHAPEHRTHLNSTGQVHIARCTGTRGFERSSWERASAKDTDKSPLATIEQSVAQNTAAQFCCTLSALRGGVSLA